ncbi:CCAAT/enhancer-binding protein zeta [Toxorhynchites rutilus septentrionalis]|uniref:CCAAT/enhancer-binding protein zeta n=1 Tax=Toxorhynchites rutilus septentrionalis TaxID=329112 RepID=UPI0024787AB2|nr:CCAAT/enhancer-binding protein zeta [Toxorhynchites rutilus septentrionalis]XP_055626174.1 CCAAT/enhancer-binding protein zeta [Toxorhynchites rutilus septentrionalis]
MAIDSESKKSHKKKDVSKNVPKLDTNQQQQPVHKKKKIVFGDDGEQREVPVDVSQTADETDTGQTNKKKDAKRSTKTESTKEDVDSMEKRWYEHFDGYNTVGELVDLKDAEIAELRKLCRVAFEAECRNQMKNNPSDAKWLMTALEKGTSRDRANAGALLVQTNPLCNLQALESIVGMVKLSNKGHVDVVEVVTELMLNSIMPAFRKLISIPLRGADWKNVKKLELEKGLRDRIYAHWHFEDALRDIYFAYLNNLSALVQTGQDVTKLKVIQHASKLFTMIPEKEAYLLSLLVNKLGDPSKKVAVKALYHLTEVVKRHSAMCPIIVTETEKLLFRNNISANAQHYALSFLAAISNYGDFSSCEKMINVCFSFFKILIEKGEVNSRTMQAILACIRKAIGNVKRDVDVANLVKPEVLNTVYRMIHMADISIACQGLSLMLEITEAKGVEQNRFYNALYKKLLDPQLASIGPRISNIFFYITHRAIQNDPISDRAQAFIKRLLQVAFYFPPARVCGVLIVINKVLRKRKHLLIDGLVPSNDAATYTEAVEDEETSVVKTESNRKVTQYDPYHRASEFAGAKYTVKYELARYLQYFHPTVKKFAGCIINNAPLTYYGDPLRDFSLGHFLDRFAFKNPKKPKTEETAEGENVPKKRILGVAQRKGDYVPSGSRGIPVQSLTADRCTEDERYIFQFLEQKREKIRLAKEYAKAKKAAEGIEDGDEEDLSDAESLDDDEFDSYLDRLGVASGNDGDADLDGEVDFINEFEQDLARKAEKKKRSKSQADEEDGEDDEEFGDWDDAENVDDEDDDDDDDEGDYSDLDEFSDDGSISLDEDGSGDDEEGEEDSEEDDEDSSLKSKKKKRKNADGLSDKAFQKKLKTNDFNSLFAAADDFSEMLEKNVGAKDKSHGTLGEVFNKDNANPKQMAWEQARFSGKNKMQSGKNRFISKKQGSSSGVDKKFKNGKVAKKKPFTKSKKGTGKVGGKRRK